MPTISPVGSKYCARTTAQSSAPPARPRKRLISARVPRPRPGSRPTAARGVTGRRRALSFPSGIGPGGEHQRIDPAELERVYPVTGSLNGQGRRDETPVDTSELTLWRTLAIEREAQSSAICAQGSNSSENDRRQIEAERRQLSERLHGLLTVKRDAWLKCGTRC